MLSRAVSLRLKVPLVFVLIVVLVFSVSGALQAHQQGQWLRESLESGADLTAAVQSDALAGALWDMNYDRVEQHIGGSQRDRNL